MAFAFRKLQDGVQVGMQVYKARSHCHVAGIDFRFADSIREIPDSHNSILVDPYVPYVRLPAGTVQDLSIFYEEVKGPG
jgi:hypothetical protein